MLSHFMLRVWNNISPQADISRSAYKTKRKFAVQHQFWYGFYPVISCYASVRNGMPGTIQLQQNGAVKAVKVVKTVKCSNESLFILPCFPYYNTDRHWKTERFKIESIKWYTKNLLKVATKRSRPWLIWFDIESASNWAF